MPYVASTLPVALFVILYINRKSLSPKSRTLQAFKELLERMLSGQFPSSCSASEVFFFLDG